MYRFSRITLIIGLCNKSNVSSDHCSGTDTLGVEHNIALRRSTNLRSLRYGCQNGLLAVGLSLRWGGDGGGKKRGVLHEGAATASDRKSQRRAAANVSCRPVAVTCVRCCQARFASFTF